MRQFAVKYRYGLKAVIFGAVPENPDTIVFLNPNKEENDV